MKLLLDTHIWLWSLLQPTQLSRKVTRALQDPDNELWLSSISVWEVLMLCRKGRLKIHEDPHSWIAKALKGRLLEAPLTHEVALATGNIELEHKDPADRFLLATARVLDLTLVTADQRLIRTPHLPILPNQ